MPCGGSFPLTFSIHPCPFLRCAEDRASVCSYPSGANVCFASPRRGKQYDGVGREKQSTRCLADYATCPKYQQRLAMLASGELVKQEPTVVRKGALGWLSRIRFPPWKRLEHDR